MVEWPYKTSRGQGTCRRYRLHNHDPNIGYLTDGINSVQNFCHYRILKGVWTASFVPLRSFASTVHHENDSHRHPRRLQRCRCLSSGHWRIPDQSQSTCCNAYDSFAMHQPLHWPAKYPWREFFESKSQRPLNFLCFVRLAHLKPRLHHVGR